jgi:mannose/cellobiose epimerase-like protein (N-acyl-D-glucosamine 2-epimerase family)
LIVSDVAAECTLAKALRSAASWLSEQALPYWAGTGQDGPHGFVEHLALDGATPSVHVKRLRVQARQIYVFSHAYLNGYGPGIDAARNGWRFVREHAWIPGEGWVRALARDGAVLDPTIDLYDHAFMLLGLAWWIQASGEDAGSWAERTLEAVDRHLATSEGVGWWSEQGAKKALLQNPHMHLLEGCLAMHATTSAGIFRQYAERVLELFDECLFEATTGTVAEYFDDSWHRAEGPRGQAMIEPGHHYEWVWLLAEASQWIPSSTTHIDELFAFAERFGCDPEYGLVYDQVLQDGSPVKRSHRLWPNTEALKAHLARFELCGKISPDRLGCILGNLFTYYLGSPTPATWIDQLDADRVPAVTKIPASSMYHIHMALAELERMTPALAATGLLDGHP